MNVKAELGGQQLTGQEEDIRRFWWSAKSPFSDRKVRLTGTGYRFYLALAVKSKIHTVRERR